MLALLVYVGDDAYAIDSRYVIEVVPQIHIKSLAQAPHAVAGVINVSGHPITVIDLCRILADRPAKESLHTRIVLLGDDDKGGGPVNTQRLGLLAERVIETIECESTDFVSTGVERKKYPFLGGLMSLPNTMVEFLDVPELCRFVDRSS